MNFRSDNEAPVLKEIIQGLLECNKGLCDSYGDDKVTKKLQKTLKQL